jgi:hypothetical protein
MSTLFTLAVALALAAWVSAVLTRLARLRSEVQLAWQRLELDISNVAVRNVYNKHVDLYNAALEVFPANFIGPAVGFKAARRFES